MSSFQMRSHEPWCICSSTLQVNVAALPFHLSVQLTEFLLSLYGQFYELGAMKLRRWPLFHRSILSGLQWIIEQKLYRNNIILKIESTPTSYDEPPAVYIKRSTFVSNAWLFIPMCIPIEGNENVPSGLKDHPYPRSYRRSISRCLKTGLIKAKR